MPLTHLRPAAPLTLAQAAQLIERQPWTVDEHGSSESVPPDTALIIAADILAAVYPDRSTDVPQPTAPSDEAQLIHGQETVFLAAQRLGMNNQLANLLVQDMAVMEALSARASTTAGGAEPIPMVLHCPKCGLQHIDHPEPPDGIEEWECAPIETAWTNPPHRSHLCAGCGHIWRPADVATTGVAAIQTRGKADSAPVAPNTVREGAALADRVNGLIKEARWWSRDTAHGALINRLADELDRLPDNAILAEEARLVASKGIHGWPSELLFRLAATLAPTSPARNDGAELTHLRPAAPLTLAQAAQLIERQPWTVDEHGSSESVPPDTALIIAADILAAVYPDRSTDVPQPTAPSDEAQLIHGQETVFLAAQRLGMNNQLANLLVQDMAVMEALSARASTTAGGATPNPIRDKNGAALSIADRVRVHTGEEGVVHAFFRGSTKSVNVLTAPGVGGLYFPFECEKVDSPAAPTSPARNARASEADMRAFGASEEACIRYPGEDQQDLRAAFMDGAAASGPARNDGATPLVDALVADLNERGVPAIKGARNDGAGRELRHCGFCKSWASKPCGEGCAWSLRDPTVAQMEAATVPDELREAAGALVKGDILQCATGHKWAGVLVIVDEVTDAGVSAYHYVSAWPHKAFVNLRADEFVRTGGNLRRARAGRGEVSGKQDEAVENGLRHYPRRHVTGDMEVVDRVFNWVRLRLAYDYRFTSNGQQWREAELICLALERPMAAAGVFRVKDGKIVSGQIGDGGADPHPSPLGPETGGE